MRCVCKKIEKFCGNLMHNIKKSDTNYGRLTIEITSTRYKMKKILSIAIFLPLICTIFGCAVSPNKQYLSSTINTYGINDGPLLSNVISQKPTDISKVYYRTWSANSEKKPNKFESESEFQLRNEKESRIDPVFIVRKLETTNCSKYDHQTGTYIIQCWGFKSSDKLQTETTKTKQAVANPYISRSVELVAQDDFYLNANVPVKANLLISVDDAKKIDDDLMVGILFVPLNTASSRSGCDKYDLDYDALKPNPCNQIAMETGMALLKKTKSLGTKSLLEMVVYRKSTNKVIVNEVFSEKN